MKPQIPALGNRCHGFFGLHRSISRTSPAFSLVEVTIALSVAAFCLLAILGLLQTGLTSQKATTEQTVATSILSMIASDILATPVSESVTEIYQLQLEPLNASPQTIYFDSASLPTGTVGAAPTAESTYRLTVGMHRVPGDSQAATGVRMLVTWPAGADSTPAQWPDGNAGAVEVWTALNRSIP